MLKLCLKASGALRWLNQKIAQLWPTAEVLELIEQAEKTNYKFMYTLSEKENKKLKKEIAIYIFTALQYQHEYHSTLNEQISPYVVFEKTENIKLAAFALAYQCNPDLGLRLAKVMRIKDLLPKHYQDLIERLGTKRQTYSDSKEQPASSSQDTPAPESAS